MPRKPRFFLPGIPQYIVQRGHSRNPVFFDKADYAVYLAGLGEAAQPLPGRLPTTMPITGLQSLSRLTSPPAELPIKSPPKLQPMFEADLSWQTK